MLTQSLKYVVLDYESLTGEAGQNNVATVFAKKVS